MAANRFAVFILARRKTSTKEHTTGCVAEWIDRSPRSREVAGSGPGGAKPKALKLALVVSSLDAQLRG